MNDKNVLLFPKLKKSNNDLKEDFDDVSNEDVTIIAKHYMGQIASHLQHQGVEINETFLRDIDMSYEFLKSAIMRSVGKFHPYQDYVDGVEQKIIEEKLKDDN